jgi:hypothetical protein
MKNPWEDPNVILHTQILNFSFHHWYGKDLIDGAENAYDLALKVYGAPFVLLSHGMEDDPVFNYANESGQKLFGYDWKTFISLPSRLSAEQNVAEARQKALEESMRKGFSENYCGVRINQAGQKFMIKNVLLYKVTDENQRNYGLAALFSDWEFL